MVFLLGHVTALSTAHGVHLFILWLLESLLLDTVFDIETVGTTATITDEQLAVAVVEAHARDVCVGDVAEHVLQTAIGSVPDLDAGGMCRDKSVEDWVVEDAKTGIFVGQVMINRLIVVVEDEGAASNNDTLGWLRHCESIDLIEGTVECLCCRVGAHVPHSDHSRDVCGDDLLRPSDPLHANQTMVVALHEEDTLLNLRVPHEDVVVEAGREDHVHVSVPVQGVHAMLVTICEGMLLLERVHVPEDDLVVHASRGDVTH